MKAVPRWLWAVVAAVLALVAFQCWRSRGQDAKADKDVATSIEIDKAHKAQTEISARVDTVVDTLWLTEKSHKAAAAVLRATGDTAGQHAVSLRDTAEMWHLRWEFRGLELQQDSLALVAADLRADSLRADRLRWHTLADSAVASQDRLRDDLRVARTGCRVIPLVPCLSRKQTLILGVGAGAFAAWYIEEQRRKKDREKDRAPTPAVGVRVTALRF